MALKGVIQGQATTGGGQLSGSGVTSVSLSGPAPFITGPPVTSAGTLTFDFSGTPIPVADGGTGMGSFAPSSLITAGLGSSSPFQSKPFPGTSSTFLDGSGAFSVPTGSGGGAGTVTSVDLSMSSEFRTSGNPVTGAGTLVVGFVQPVSVAHGGTGMGSFAANSLVRAGLTSTGPFQSTPLPGLTSTFLDGSGAFSTPPTPAGSGGTVTSVDLSMSSEFRISGNPIVGAGTLVAGFVQPLNVAHGGTGFGSFAASSVIRAGLSSTGPFQSTPLSNLSSTFLDGTGNFTTPPTTPTGGTGTVTSVDLALSSEFTVSGNPITTAGQLVVGWRGPLDVAHGGTGMGSWGPSVVLGGLTSTADLQGLPLTNLSSTFLRGDGVFSIPINPGGTVQSVGLSMTSEFAIQRSPVIGSGTIDIGFVQPLAVAHGGTGLGSVGIGALLRGGLSSTAPFQGLPFPNLTSNFLRGDGVFSIPVNPGGTVQSVALTMTSEFSITGSPILGSGTVDIGFRQPLAVAHGGTGLGSTGIGAVLRGGLSSTAPLQGTPLTNLTSTFLDGTGAFSVPPTGGGAGAGTVTSVALQLTSEFNITGSPVTSAGTLMASFAFQSANFIFGGPGTGTPTTPAFRQLVNADVPQSLSGKTMSSSTFQNPTIKAQLLTFGSSIQWNMNSGTIAFLGMNSNTVGLMDTPANLPNAGTAILRVMQLGTGLINLNFNAAWKWESAVKPTLSSGFSKIDVVTLYLESTAVYGVARKDFR